jgi:hypothetical protein
MKFIDTDFMNLIDSEDERSNKDSRADSVDDLECFGEFSRSDKMCTKYCSCSIQCAIGIDYLDHILNLHFYPARTN